MASHRAPAHPLDLTAMGHVCRGYAPRGRRGVQGWAELQEATVCTLGAGQPARRTNDAAPLAAADALASVQDLTLRGLASRTQLATVLDELLPGSASRASSATRGHSGALAAHEAAHRAELRRYGRLHLATLSNVAQLLPALAAVGLLTPGIMEVRAWRCPVACC
jgi:hypothetical protein